MCLKYSCSVFDIYSTRYYNVLMKLLNYFDSNILFLFSCLDSPVHRYKMLTMVLSLFIYRYLYDYVRFDLRSDVRNKLNCRQNRLSGSCDVDRKQVPDENVPIGEPPQRMTYCIPPKFLALSGLAHNVPTSFYFKPLVCILY